MSAALDYAPAIAPVAPVPAVRILPVPDRDPAPSSGPPRSPVALRRVHGQQLRLVVVEPPVPAGSHDVPDVTTGVAEVAHQLAQGVVDVLAGHRPAHQLVRWVRPDVFDAVRRRSTVSLPQQASNVRSIRRPVVKSIHLCHVVADVVEAAAVVVDGDRVKALAMRLEGRDGRWRLAALTIG